MTKSKSLGARIRAIPLWIFLLPTVVVLGLSYWRDYKNEQVKEQWTMRIGAVETQVKSTEKMLSDYNADSKKLEQKLALAKNRGGATDAQTREFDAEAARLGRQLAMMDEQGGRSRAMLDKLQRDKDAGLFDKL